MADKTKDEKTVEKIKKIQETKSKKDVKPSKEAIKRGTKTSK